MNNKYFVVRVMKYKEEVYILVISDNDLDKSITLNKKSINKKHDIHIYIFLKNM